MALQDQPVFGKTKAKPTVAYPYRNPDLKNLNALAHTHFKQAELLEMKGLFNKASHHYQKTFLVLERLASYLTLSQHERLLMAQSALSLADLMVHKKINQIETGLKHPLYYVNTALETLEAVSLLNTRVLSTYAYAHQIAGFVLTPLDFKAARNSFHFAIKTALKIKTRKVLDFLSDIYTGLGLLYETEYRKYLAIQKIPNDWLNEAALYFELAFLLNREEWGQDEEADETKAFILDAIYETIDVSLNPYYSTLSKTALIDLIDALVSLNRYDEPLQLHDEILQAELIEALLQELLWKEQPKIAYHGLELRKEALLETRLYASRILKIIQKAPRNNVYCLETFRSRSKKSSSDNTGIPNDCALSRFEPGDSPTTT